MFQKVSFNQYPIKFSAVRIKCNFNIISITELAFYDHGKITATAIAFDFLYFSNL